MAVKKRKYPVAGIVDLREILKEQDYICALTGKKLTPETTCFDHIKPLSKGGSSLKRNLQAVTKVANKSKQDLLPKEFIELCYQVLETNGGKYGISVRKSK